MGNDWMPEQVYMKDSFIQNITENPSGIQFVHRMMALIVVLVLGLLWNKSTKLNLTKYQQLGVTLLIYGLTVQFILGVFTLIYNVPVFLGALHQTGAFFLFLSSIFLIFHLFNYTKNSERIG